MSSSSLSSTVRRGALWSIATTATLKLANVLITAVIAHILDPRDFGVFAVALTAYGIIVAIGEFGLGSCLIRADLDIDSLAPTMTTVALTTNAIQAGVLVAFAEPIATALGSTAAAGPIRVLALAMFITGVFAVPGAQLIRDFKQDKVFLANFIGFLVSTAVLILLAISGSEAMAFAWSMVAGVSVSGFVMFASVPRHYRLGFSRHALDVLIRFGFPLAGANIINYVLLNGDYVVVGHLAGAVALGAYVLAFNVASWPSSLLGFMINNVSMPAFSRVKDDADRLKYAIARAVRAISLVVMPISALTIALARPIVLTLYGPKWTASVQPLSILAFYGAISIICVLFANILAGLGRAKFILVVQLIWLVALVPGMVLGVHHDGIAGAAVAHVIVIGPIVLPLYLFGLRKITDLVALARAVLPALVGASTAALAATSMASRFTDPLVQLIAGLVAGGLTYTVIVVPFAMTLLGQEQITKLHARRILRLYNTAARLVGLSAGRRPKHAGKSRGGPARQVPTRASRDHSLGVVAGVGQWQDGARRQNPMAIVAGDLSGPADTRAVASAATTPIPVVRAGTDHPVDATATTPLPVVASGALQRADAAAQPQEQTSARRSLWTGLRTRLERSEMPADAATVEARTQPGETAPAGTGNDGPPMSGTGAPAVTQPDMFPAPRASARGAPPHPVNGEHQDHRVPLRPRPYVGGSAALQREKDLARRSCPRIRCTCEDPTICPAIAVDREPASESPAIGWQMPSAERGQPDFTTLMSLAAASAATMPIPIVPGTLAYPFATTATRPLPMVPTDIAPPKPHTDVDARRSPVTEEDSGDRKGLSDGQYPDR